MRLEFAYPQYIIGWLMLGAAVMPCVFWSLIAGLVSLGLWIGGVI